MRYRFAVEELQDIQLAAPFSFTKGCRTMKIPTRQPDQPIRRQTMLFDLATDPDQTAPINDPTQ